MNPFSYSKSDIFGFYYIKQMLLSSLSLNFTAATTNGDKPLDAELNFDVYHVHNKLFKHTSTQFKLWDARHVTTTPPFY